MQETWGELPRERMPVLAMPDNIWFPTSNGVEMCIDAYLEQVANELSGEAELATVLPVAMPQDAGIREGPVNNPASVVKAGPGHLYMCAHACMLGALHATEKTTQRMLQSARTSSTPSRTRSPRMQRSTRKRAQ